MMCNCAQTVREHYERLGIDAFVTTAPPIIDTGYDPLNMRCPHGAVFYAEPTSEQRAKWAREGVR